MGSINGKHILITGGASGMGFLMARGALQRNAKQVTIWDIDPKKIASAEKKLRSFSSNRLSTYRVDIGQADQIYEIAERVQQRVGAVDILINNAGVISGGQFQQQSPSDIEQTIAINLTGAMHVTRAFLEKMNDQKTGHIVNIASAAGLLANPKMAVYAGSKAGMIGWSDSLRIELQQAGSNVGVTTVQPSYINTGMFEGVTAPLMTPLLDPKKFAQDILDAIQHDRIHLRAPFMVKFIPFLKGILPTRIFDFVAGKLFGVYTSMDTFTGRTSSQTNSPQ